MDTPQNIPPASSSPNAKDEGKTPFIICIILSIFGLLTLILGLIFHNPYLIIAGIPPAAIYEAIRTEGYYTKIASVSIVILVFLEILAILNIIQINLAGTLSQGQAYFRGFFIPLGDIKFVFPLIALVLSISLLYYTYGKYTKWLSIILLASSAALVYIVNQQALIDVIRQYL
jgi:hypothetical protein